jgi:hypothetical protein
MTSYDNLVVISEWRLIASWLARADEWSFAKPSSRTALRVAQKEM